VSAQRSVAATFTAFAVAALAACTSFGYEPTQLPQSSASATASRGIIERAGLVHHLSYRIGAVEPRERLDHMLITRNLVAHYRGSEIHNEILHDRMPGFALRSP
jgi:hypothetical protein